jgi:hypothetical protein
MYVEELQETEERIEKSHRQGQKGISSERMYRDYGISQNRPLQFDVHEDKRTRLEGDPRDSKYWHRTLSRE